jgi:hypothetical protein
MRNVGLEIRDGEDDVLGHEFLSIHRKGQREQEEQRHQSSSVEPFARAGEGVGVRDEVLPGGCGTREQFDAKEMI